MRARLCAAYALNRVLISVCEFVYIVPNWGYV